LPSKLCFFNGFRLFQLTLNMPLDLINIDGLGYQPDFWVNTDDIADRVIKFIYKYKLNN
jgi:hypothetical protein